MPQKHGACFLRDQGKTTFSQVKFQLKTSPRSNAIVFHVRHLQNVKGRSLYRIGKVLSVRVVALGVCTVVSRFRIYIL